MSTDGTIPDRVLSRPAILEARTQGQILIEPFEDRCVKGGSVDVRLGEWYFEEQRPGKRGASDWEYMSQRDWWQHYSLPASKPYQGDRTDPSTSLRVSTLPMLNPYDEKSVSSMWGSPKQAKAFDFDLPGIKAGTPVIVIPPGGAFLGHTMEFIGSLHPEVTFMVKTRSSVGRNRIRLCACAGWGDQGFASRVVLEISNDSQFRNTILVPGRRVGQIVFIPTTPLAQGDMYFSKGKYQTSSSAGKTYDQLVAEWKPEMMLPKQWLDWEVGDQG